MRHSQLATLLIQKHQHRQFKAFLTCEVITVAPNPQNTYRSFWLEITKYRFNLNLISRPIVSILKLDV